GVVAERAEHGFLEAVLGLGRTHRAGQECQDSPSVLVEHRLERGQGRRFHRAHCIPNAGVHANVSRAAQRQAGGVSSAWSSAGASTGKATATSNTSPSRQMV